MKLLHPTLSQFILEEEKRHGASGQFTNALMDLGVVGKLISREMNRAGLVNILGEAGEENVSGDAVKKLDVLANDLFKDYLSKTQHFCAFASEEEEGIVALGNGKQSKYVIAFDPIDGSSNIDYNVSVGTIFSIHSQVSGTDGGTMEDFLQPGKDQAAAGYIIYGSSTIMVFTTGNGTHGFTLDPSIGEWLLSHPHIQIPNECDTYSANEVYVNTWDEASRRFLQEFKDNNNKATSRHIGSLVADIHRNILKGGIHIRPYDHFIEKKAKLRLNFELKPIAMVIEQAGGYSTDGTKNILEIVPASLHATSPFVAGNAMEVKEYEKVYSAANGSSG